jgi:hypothetical protein
MSERAKSAYLIFIENSNEGIDKSTLEFALSKVKDSKADHLYLILESYGGDPSSAVSLMNVLDANFTKISAIVPRYAKSAATLMALGTNEIYMNPRSGLGPLDLQIEHHRDGSRISALDVRNTITSMAALVNTLAKAKFKTLREREISALEASRLSMQNATDFLEPIVRQVDPYHLQRAERGLNVGRLYAIRMLKKRMMKGKPSQASTTAQDLVDIFPAHDYCIYSDDAKGLNLEIKDLDELPVWNGTLKSKYESASGQYFKIEYGIIEKNDDNSKDQKKKRNKPNAR